jgi:hypothetical protein
MMASTYGEGIKQKKYAAEFRPKRMSKTKGCIMIVNRTARFQRGVRLLRPLPPTAALRRCPRTQHASCHPQQRRYRRCSCCSCHRPGLAMCSRKDNVLESSWRVPQCRGSPAAARCRAIAAANPVRRGRDSGSGCCAAGKGWNQSSIWLDTLLTEIAAWMSCRWQL